MVVFIEIFGWDEESSTGAGCMGSMGGTRKRVGQSKGILVFQSFARLRLIVKGKSMQARVRRYWCWKGELHIVG